MSRNSDEDMLYWQVGLALAHIVGVSRKRKYQICTCSITAILLV
jgi:hypothetical protein